MSMGLLMTQNAPPGDASTGYFDRCIDPESTGVIGVRKFPNPSGGPPLIGVTCAACHAGFDPVRPPSNPNTPQKDNIHGWSYRSIPGCNGSVAES